jgi:Rrf2 family protein
LCVRLATTGPKFYSTRKVAEEFDFSINHLAKVVQKLVKAGILESSRGKMGGVRLRKPQDQITLAELNESVSELEEGGCLLSRRVCTGCNCAFGRWLSAENQKIEENLRKMTIKEIAASIGLK